MGFSLLGLENPDFFMETYINNGKKLWDFLEIMDLCS